MMIMVETALFELERESHKTKGLYTLAQLKNAGASVASVQRAVRGGKLERVARGVYKLPEMMEDEMFNAQCRRNKMIYSHDTALYLHELNDRDPLRYSVTVPIGYNTKRLIDDGFRVFSLRKELHGQDIEEVATEYGNMVRTYSVERTICDCIRSRNKLQSDIIYTGLKGYLRRNNRNLNMLMKTAEKLGVASLLRTYLEVLL